MYGYMKVYSGKIPDNEIEYVNGMPFYYADESQVESYAQSYFDVLVAHLRTADAYDADKKTYVFGMSGVGWGYVFHVLRAEYNDATKQLVLYVDNGMPVAEGGGKEVAKLTIQLEDNGNFKYISNEML